MGVYETHVFPEKPANLAEMISVAEKLSEHFDFIRVDLYSGDDFIYVGELTHCHMTASERISTEEEILLSETIFGDRKYNSKA